MRRLWVLVLAGLLLVAASCGDQGVEPDGTADAAAEASAADCEPGTTVDALQEHDLVYAQAKDVDPNLLSLDLDVPAHDACEPPPIVVFVHGGGWRLGDKAGGDVELKRQLVTEAGWAFASVNHRLSPEPHDLADADRVTYPTHPQDVAAALAHLDAQAADLGVDTSRIALVGHSAGAGIVSTLGTDVSFLDDAGLEPSQLSCIVSLDTEAYDVTEGATTPGMVGLTYQNAFTTDPEVWEQASPVNHVDGDEPAFLVVTRGQADRTEMAGAFVQQLDEAGVDATLLDASPYSHSDVNRLLGTDEDEVVTPAVGSFLERCLTDG